MRSLNLKRAALVAIRLLTVACVLFGATVLFIRFRYTSPEHGFLISTVGITNGCSEAAVQDAHVRRQRRADITAKLRTELHLLQRDGRFEQWRTPVGDYWITAGDQADLASVAVETIDGQYSRLAVTHGATVIDVGAAIGTFTRAALAAGAAQVVAVEPLPANVECLRRNFAEEIRAGRVIVYPKGLWNRVSSMMMRSYPGSFLQGSVVIDDSRHVPDVSVPLVTLDSAVAEIGLGRVDFIKMDIEGAEENALLGAAGTLRRFHPRMAVCVYHNFSDVRRLPQVVQQLQPKYVSHVDHCMPWRALDVRAEVMIFDAGEIRAASSAPPGGRPLRRLE